MVDSFIGRMIFIFVVLSVLLLLVRGEVDENPHEFQKWRFEDIFGVELQMVLLVSVCVLVIVLIICTEAWTVVSWLIQFQRTFAICFFIGIIWNWFFLYKTAFANHQKNLVKLASISDRCRGLTEMTYWDNIYEWYRTTFTLQDDPCKEYYEALEISPFLLVPPHKAFLVTITTCFTEPMKYVGQGINEFTRALLKDLPVQIQTILSLTVLLFILVFIYGSGQAVIQQAVHWNRRGHSQDPRRRQDMNQAWKNSRNHQRWYQRNYWSRVPVMNIGHAKPQPKSREDRPRRKQGSFRKGASVLVSSCRGTSKRGEKGEAKPKWGWMPRVPFHYLPINPQNARHQHETRSEGGKFTNSPTNICKCHCIY